MIVVKASKDGKCHYLQESHLQALTQSTAAFGQLQKPAKTHYVTKPKEKKSTSKKFYFQGERNVNYFQAINK